MVDLYLPGVLALTPANVAYADALELPLTLPWLLPYPGSIVTLCETCRGVMHIGPHTQLLARQHEAVGTAVHLICFHDAKALNLDLASIIEAGS